MAKGDLRTYLAEHRPPYELQLAWFRDMARTLIYIHDKRVLVADIATRNFLLDSHLSIKTCDFSETSLLPLDFNMKTVDDRRFNAQIDVGLLGAVIYEVVTGNKCEIDLFKDNSPFDGRAYWPERKFLPSTQSIWLGWIIERCWDGEFRSADSLMRSLYFVETSPSPSMRGFQPGFYGESNGRSIKPITGVLGLIMFTFMTGRRAFLVSRGLSRLLGLPRIVVWLTAARPSRMDLRPIMSSGPISCRTNPCQIQSLVIFSEFVIIAVIFYVACPGITEPHGETSVETSQTGYRIRVNPA